MIDGFINAKETVVGTTEHSNLYRRILAVMTVDVKAKLATYLLSIDASRNIFASLIKQSQDGFIYIIVYKNNALFGTFHEFRNKGISIIEIFVLQSLCLLGSNSVPIPGAAGVSEGLYISAFKPFFAKTML